MSETQLITQIADLQKRAEAYERIKDTRTLAIDTLRQIKVLVDVALKGLEPNVVIGDSRRNGKRSEMINEIHQKMIEGSSFSREDIEKIYNIEQKTAVYIYTTLKSFSDVKLRDVRDGKKLKNLYVR